MVIIKFVFLVLQINCDKTDSEYLEYSDDYCKSTFFDKISGFVALDARTENVQESDAQPTSVGACEDITSQDFFGEEIEVVSQSINDPIKEADSNEKLHFSKKRERENDSEDVAIYYIFLPFGSDDFKDSDNNKPSHSLKKRVRKCDSEHDSTYFASLYIEDSGVTEFESKARCDQDTKSQTNTYLILNSEKVKRFKELLQDTRSKCFKLYNDRRFNRGLSMFSEIIPISYLLILNEKDIKVEEFLTCFYDLIKNHSISSTLRYDPLLENIILTREELCEHLKKNCNWLNEKLNVYKMMIELDKLLNNEKTKEGIRRTTGLYGFIFVLEEEQLKKFEEKLIEIKNSKTKTKLDEKPTTMKNSRPQVPLPKTYDILENIDKKEFIHILIDLKDIHDYILNVRESGMGKLIFQHKKTFDRFIEKLKSIESYIFSNREMLLIVRAFEIYKSVFKGCQNSLFLNSYAGSIKLIEDLELYLNE